ncbi:MAG: slipin family protein [Clostridia bacterium]|nr:slipin family protein [Clostridia bacterium]
MTTSSIALIVIGAILLLLILSSVRQIDEYERGVKFTCGKFTKVLQPGWHIIIPIFQKYQKIDVRVKVVDVPEQDAITKDNVSIKINAVIYYSIFDAKKALLSVSNCYYAVTQLAQTTMRNIVGSVTLDELLVDREKISNEICSIVDTATDEWGVKIKNVELKDVALPSEMQRVIAKVAEAEREKAAVITKASGELEASKNLSLAAQQLSNSPGALHLRTLSTINDVSSDQSNTIIFAIPIEVLNAFGGNNKLQDYAVKAVEKVKTVKKKAKK